MSDIEKGRDHTEAKVKKPGVFSRMGKSISKWFRELKSEAKKVVWPTRKQVVNNTAIVIGVIIVAGVFIALLDFLFKFGLVDLLLKIKA